MSRKASLAHFLLQSQQLYCLLTDATGQVIEANDRAKALTQLQATTAYPVSSQLAAIHQSGIVTTTYFFNGGPQVIDWEVCKLQPEDNAGDCFQWIAAAPKEMAINASFQKPVLEANQQLQYQATVLENVSDIVITTDLDFTIQSWNKIAEHYYGHAEEEVIGGKISSFVQFHFSKLVHTQMMETLTSKGFWKGEVSFTNQNGEVIHLLHSTTCIYNQQGVQIGYMGVSRDITERKKEEQQLEQSELFYRNLIADSLDGILLTNAFGVITFASASMRHILHYEPQELIGINCFEFVHPDDQIWAQESFQREVSENPEIKSVTIRLRKKSGDWLWCMVQGNNQLTTPGVNSVVVYLQDYTQRKLANDALKESEKRFRKLMQELKTGVLLMDTNAKVLMVNDEALRMFETTEDKVIGQRMPDVCDDAIHEDGRPFLLNERPTFVAVKSGCHVKDIVMGVWSKRRKERRWFLISADPVEDNDGHLQSVISTFTDITERKKAERKSIAEEIAHQREIAQATIDGQEKERLEMGRELHDNVGQQLTSIKLFLDLAKTMAGDDIRNLIDIALKNVSNVIDEVRFMSRSLVPPTLKDLGLVDSVNDLVDSLRTTQPLNFELTYVDVDEEHLPENKKLALFRILQEQLNNVLKYAGANKVSIALRYSNGQIELKIKDDGVGFDLSKIRRGMGLTNIINRSELFGGRVEIVTAPGKGCSVNVWLPHTVKGSVAV